jgi:hypothetical protein
MLINFILLVSMSLGKDSIAYVNSDGIYAYSTKVSGDANAKEIVKAVKQATRLHGGIIAKRSEGCWKFLNEEGKLVSDSCISQFKLAGNGKLAAQCNLKWALFDLKTSRQTASFIYSEFKISDGVLLGKEFNKIEVSHSSTLNKEKLFYFDGISFLDSNYCVDNISGKFGLVNFRTGKTILKPDFENITRLSDSLFAICQNKKWGVVKRTGKFILPFEYDRIEADTLGFLKLSTFKISSVGDVKNLKPIDEKFGISNSDGKVIIPVSYEGIGDLTEGLYPVRKGELWGFVNLKGEEIVPYFYRKTKNFCSGIAPVTKGFYDGIIDKRGSWVLPPDFSEIQIVNDSVWIWNRRDRAGFYYPKTRLFSKESFEEIKLLEGGWFRVSENSYGLLSPDRRQVLKNEYTSVKVFPSEKIIVAGKINFYSIYYLNGNLKVFMNYPFSIFMPYQDGMAMVVQNERYGFIDRDGQLMVSTQYDEARPFSHGMAAIKLNGRWGFVDKNEKIAASPNYTEVLDFTGDATAGKRDGKWAFIDRSGKEILKPQYDNVYQTSLGNYVVKSGTKSGLVDVNGIEVINPVYRDCIEIGKGVIKVRSYNKYGLVNMLNIPISSQQYDDIFFFQSARKLVFITKGEWKGL